MMVTIIISQIQSEKTSFLTMYYTSCSQAKCTVIIMINCAGASNHNLVFNCEKLKPQFLEMQYPC